jgi:hypothetical protein
MPIRGGGTRGRRADTILFTAVFVVASVAIAYWIHHRDTTHGDHWDWSDWLECVAASVAAGTLTAWGVVKLRLAVRNR